MRDLIQTVSMYLSFPFVKYAFIAGIMIALSSSLLGVTLVLKRFSYIGDGLSHTAFGAMALASVFKLTNDTWFVLPVTVLCAIVILCAKESSKIKGDASVAMISVGALAFGYLIMNLFSPPANLSGDVCSTLFGSTLILTLSKTDVIFSVVFSLLVVAFFIFFYNKIFSITFDEEFAFASGIPTRFINIIMACVIAIIIVLALNLVGSLLISALIIFPAISAMLIFKSFKQVTIFSCIFSVIGAASGILISIIAGTPVGSTIVMIDILCFFICKTVSLIKNK